MFRYSLVPAAVLGLALAVGTPGGDPRAEAAGRAAPFAAFVDDYFDAYFTWKPSEGTAGTPPVQRQA